MTWYIPLRTTHTRGGDPLDKPFNIYSPSYYPHTWGWSSNLSLAPLGNSVLPTHVGVIQKYGVLLVILVSTTHTRGGDPTGPYKNNSFATYYPHTWGWSWGCIRVYTTIFVLPTHVGVILNVATLEYTCSCTTHTRGGDPTLFLPYFYHHSYYPHTWGWSYGGVYKKYNLVVLPTHVGVILLLIQNLLYRIRTTHTRGGDPILFFQPFLQVLYYPHTWGWS